MLCLHCDGTSNRFHIMMSIFRSCSGVVNIYDDTYMTSHTPTPLKAVMNLTTPCTNMVFNSKTEILAISSSHAENAVKMVRMLLSIVPPQSQVPYVVSENYWRFVFFKHYGIWKQKNNVPICS